MKNTLFVLISSVCSFYASSQTPVDPLGFFANNWGLKSFNIPTSSTPITLPISGVATASVTFFLGDTIGKVLPTQFGTNTTFRTSVLDRTVNDYLNPGKFIEEKNIFNRLGTYRSSGMGTYRYPAGSGSNIFFWDGIAPQNTKKVINQKTEVESVIPIIGNKQNTFTPAKFVEFKKLMNCQANVNVNYFYARYGTTPEDSRVGATEVEKRNARVLQAAKYAAGFVKHMNIDLGAKIKYWEVGNECYGAWEEGYNIDGQIVTGKEYGEDFNVFVTEMKKVDPTIKVGAVVWAGNGQREKNWTSGVLSQVKDKADFLVMHEYFAAQGTAQTVMESPTTLTANVDIIKDWVVTYAGKPRNFFPIALTEFNTQNPLNSTNMANGLFFTQLLGETIKNNIGLATSWVNEWPGGGKIPEVNTHGLLTMNDSRQQGYSPRSTFMPYHFYKKYFGSYMLKATSSKSNVKVYASGYKGKELGVVLVNTGGTQELVDLNVDPLKYNEAYWHEMYALNVNTDNSKFFINGQTSNTIGGGPLNFENIIPYQATYSAKSLFKLKPYSATFIAFAKKITTEVEAEVELGNSFRIYPNPSKDGVFNLSESDVWKVTSLTGKELKSGNGNLIDLSNYPKGIYFIMINEKVERVVVE